uniref:SYO1-like TPR repeats domain-containing protein n=1 Tax=Craspedostauros australis TaxID=1486917 RepID=A0A7R9WNS5_9STRA
MLEDDIMKAVETRKESSRDIARRQKTNPRQEKAKFGERVDGQQEMQVAVSQWEQCVNPLHVALEVSANLLGSMMQDEDAMSSEQDEASNLLLAQAMGQKPFVDRIIDLVLVLGGYRLAPHETASNLRIDVVEVISKALACLSNIAMGETVLAEALGKNGKLGQLWQMLKKSLDVTGATSAMVVFTRSYAVCRAQVVGDDFNFVLHQMLERTPDESVQIDTLSMLASAVTSGIASLDAVVEQMTVALLKLPQTGASAQLVCETLNALIDIYSDDDLYAEIFRRLNVLNHFQNCLGKVSQQSLMSEHTAEILANVEAFIDYKLAN